MLCKITIGSFLYAFKIKEGTQGRSHESVRKQGRDWITE